MNNITRYLLGGAALCALAAVPAVASNLPAIHLAVSKNTPLHFRGSSLAHSKTNSHNPGDTNFTETVTFSANLTSADYKQKLDLLGETWYSSTSCTQPTKQKWKKLPKKTSFAKVGTATSTGTIAGCTGTIFTFQDITYDWDKKQSGGNDEVTGDLDAKKFEGYNLKLIANIDITLS